jgi:hypothetical protein
MQFEYVIYNECEVSGEFKIIILKFYIELKLISSMVLKTTNKSLILN